MICGTAVGPCTAVLRTSKRTAGPPLRDTQHIVLGGAGPPGDQPDGAGQEGQRPLEPWIEQTLRREQRPQAFDPGEQFADTDGPDLGDSQRYGPRPVQNDSLPNITTRLPSVRGTGASRSSCGEHVTDSDMSTDGSRSTRNAVRVPGRALI